MTQQHAASAAAPKLAGRARSAAACGSQVGIDVASQMSVRKQQYLPGRHVTYQHCLRHRVTVYGVVELVGRSRSLGAEIKGGLWLRNEFSGKAEVVIITLAVKYLSLCHGSTRDTRTLRGLSYV